VEAQVKPSGFSAGVGPNPGSLTPSGWVRPELTRGAKANSLEFLIYNILVGAISAVKEISVI
jgi:hypothetical protein